MRVAYLTNQYPKVSHTFIRREIHALEALGIEVDRFAVRRPDEDLADPADRAEAQRTRILLDAGMLGLLGAVARCALARPSAFARALALAVKTALRSDTSLARHGVYLAEACLLRRWLADAPPTRLHAHFGTNPATVAMLCNALGGPAFSFTVHGPEEFDRSSGIALAEKISRAHEVFAITDFARSQLYRHAAPSQWDKIQVVPCGLDESFLGQEPTVVPDNRRLVCVGRLCEQKGQLLLVEAVARLVAEGVDVELVFAGDGEMRRDLESLVSSRGLDDRVHVTGWLSGADVRRLLVESRGLVLPSFAEGLPVVLMEALALGRPVVTTWVAGIPELVQPGRCGWLVPPGSLEQLVAAVRELLETGTAELTRMGQEGRRRVAARHAASASARRIQAIWWPETRPVSPRGFEVGGTGGDASPAPRRRRPREGVSP